MVVVFPEPFGPRKPNTLPAGTSRSTESTATCPLPPAENRLPIAVEAGEKLPYEYGSPA